MSHREGAGRKAGGPEGTGVMLGGMTPPRGGRGHLGWDRRGADQVSLH